MGGAVGGKSCPGSSQWTFSPEEVCTTLQPGTLGRNCASEKVYLLWDRRRKLFSRRLGLVGRKTKQKKTHRKVNVREELGCIISKDRQNNWVVTGTQAKRW